MNGDITSEVLRQRQRAYKVAAYSPQKTITMDSPDFALLTLTRRGQTGSSRQTASISSAPDKYLPLTSTC